MDQYVRKVMSQTLWLLNVSDTDKLDIQVTCKPNAIIDNYTWKVYCLPQIIRRSLIWTAFSDYRS